MILNKFNNNVEPEYIGNTELENGIYRKNENNEYQLDINLNQEINNKISEMKNDIILKEKENLLQTMPHIQVKHGLSTSRIVGHCS